jgi:ribose-phosphate pyrophosphokinase
MPGKLVDMQITYTSDMEQLAHDIYAAIPGILQKKLRLYDELLCLNKADRKAYLEQTQEPPTVIEDRRTDMQRYLEQVHGCGYDDFCSLESEKHFGDGEYKPKPRKGRGRDVFLLAGFRQPDGEEFYSPNDGYMRMLLTLDALRRASARSRILVAPFMAYEKQDRKDESRVPISFRMVADLLETVGTTRVLTLDLHASQEQGFYRIPFDDLSPLNFSIPVLQELKQKYKFLTVVDPDAGSAKRNEDIVKILEVPEVIVDKRKEDYVARVNEMNGVDQIPGKVTVIVDDQVGSARTGIEVAERVSTYKPLKTILLGSHLIGNPREIGDPVSGLDKLQECPFIDEIHVTNSNYSTRWGKYPKIKVHSVGNLFGEAIIETQTDGSVTHLFPDGRKRVIQ